MALGSEVVQKIARNEVSLVLKAVGGVDACAAATGADRGVRHVGIAGHAGPAGGDGPRGGIGDLRERDGSGEFHKPIVHQTSEFGTVNFWYFFQTDDEFCSIEWLIDY